MFSCGSRQLKEQISNLEIVLLCCFFQDSHVREDIVFFLALGLFEFFVYTVFSIGSVVSGTLATD